MIENSRKIWYYIGLLLVSTGVALAIWSQNLIIKIIGALLCAMGAAFLISYYKQKIRKMEEQNIVTNGKEEIQPEQEEQEQEETHVSENEPQVEQNELKSLPELSRKSSLEDRIENLRRYVEEKDGFDDNYKNFFAVLKRSAKYLSILRSINQNFTTPVLDKLGKEEYVLDETNKQKLLGDLVQLALVTIDFTQEYHTELDGYDSLAIKVAEGTISPDDDVVKHAKHANTNIYETEKVIRVLDQLVGELGLNGKTLIVKDTVL